MILHSVHLCWRHVEAEQNRLVTRLKPAPGYYALAAGGVYFKRSSPVAVNVVSVGSASNGNNVLFRITNNASS